MSILTLPEETISQIVAHLSPLDRHTLRLTHPALASTLSSTNEPFWRSIHATRYTATAPNARSSHHAVQLREAADDYLIHRRLPFKTLSHTPLAPLLAHERGVTHIAAGSTYLTYPASRRRYTLEADATALCVSPDPAIGLSNGAVYTPNTARVHRGHKAGVSSLAQSGGLLVSGSGDKTIRVRNSVSRRTHAVLRGHDAAVGWLHLQGQHLFSHGGADARVKLWDLTRAACVSTARPGRVVDAVMHNGCVYAAMRNCVHVLDARVGMATVAVLSLPRGGGWCDIGALALAEDGALVACVGGGGVAMWDALGGWVARGVGWPRRWEGREGRRLRSLIVGERGIVTGGGARELLTFARNGGYEGMIAEDGVRKGGVVKLVKTDEGFVVGRACGRVEITRVKDGLVDWDAAERAVAEESGEKGFWERGSL